MEKIRSSHGAENGLVVSEFIEKMERLGSFPERIESPPDLDQIWRALVQELHYAIAVDGCALFLVDAESREFCLHAAEPAPMASRCKQEIDLQIETGIFSWIVNRRQPALIPPLTPGRSANVVVLPLCTVRQTLGAAMVVTPIAEAAITREHMKLLTLLAKQCALVMENTELYGRLNREHASLLAAREKMHQAEKMASMGKLTSGACHEILNPVGILSGHLQMLKMSPDAASRLPRALAVMLEQTDRIARIVKGLQVFSEHGLSRRTPTVLQDLVAGCIEKEAGQNDRCRTAVQTRFDAPGIRVDADAQSLGRAISEVIKNAREAMPEGGRLTVSVRPAADSAEFVEAVFDDTGCGIEEDGLARVFDPFFTTKTAQSAVGLGLSLCYGIVRDHGGTTRMESRPGAGSRFVFRLPVSPENS